MPIPNLPPPIGDVDGDGSITVADAVLLLRFTVGVITLTPDQQGAADLNGTDGVNVGDAVLILRRVVGL